MIRSRLVLATAAALVLGAACGRSAPAPSRSGTTPLRGVILGSAGTFFSGDVGLYRLPRQGTAIPLKIPATGNAFTSYWGPFFGPDRRTPYSFLPIDEGHSRLYALSTSTDPKPVGPPIGTGFGATVSHAGDLVLTCEDSTRTMRVLDLSRPRSWREVAPGCQGTLSPDGSAVAYSPDRVTVYERPVAGGASTRVFSVLDYPEIRHAGIQKPRVGPMSWGAGGLAVQVWDASSTQGGVPTVILVKPASGSVELVAPPGSGGGFFQSFAWQPGGPLLAYSDGLSGGGAALRLFDAATGASSVVATDPQWVGSVVWSPDGKVIALQNSGGGTLFVDVQGNWIDREGTGGAELYDWTSAA